MRSCSDSIAQLASALAKAQSELVNPLKTLTGIIDRWGSGNEGQSYRYAPLSAGLDIVRKTLCKHELAVIQTTEVEQDSGMVMLTTTLAHGSGEWVAASWPVCRTADMTNPKLMGAALTYARRYSLFTLVGIAGDDDLDAPELVTVPPANDAAASALPAGGPKPNGHDDDASVPGRSAEDSASPPERLLPVLERSRKKRRDAGVPRGPRAPAGSVEAAMHELAAIDSADALFIWALDALPLRNNVPDASREALDAAFLARAEALGADPEVLLAFRLPPSAAPASGAASSVS